MDGWMDGRLDGWESNGTSLWKKESLIDLSSRQVSERTPRPLLLPTTASPGGGSAGCLLPAPAFKSLAGDTNVSPVDLPARVGTKGPADYSPPGRSFRGKQEQIGTLGCGRGCTPTEGRALLYPSTLGHRDG